MNARLGAAVAAALAAVGSGAAWAADPAKMDWSAIPKSEVVLFYPGQATLQWTLSNEHRKGGAKGVREGETCLECHKGEEADIGDKIVAGKRLEPTPIRGKLGSVKVTMQAAYDNENLYLKSSWPAKEAGVFHMYVVYKDGKWEEYTSDRGDEAVAAGKVKASYSAACSRSSRLPSLSADANLATSSADASAKDRLALLVANMEGWVKYFSSACGRIHSVCAVTKVAGGFPADGVDNT